MPNANRQDDSVQSQVQVPRGSYLVDEHQLRIKSMAII